MKVSTQTEPSAPIPTNTDDAVECLARALTFDDSGAVPHGPGYAAEHGRQRRIGHGQVQPHRRRVLRHAALSADRELRLRCRGTHAGDLAELYVRAARVSTQRVGGIG